jgi:Zn-dependent membrane protease YugP
MIFDPVYLVILAITMVIALGAQARVKGSFNKWSKVAASSRVTGAEAARRMLDAAGIRGVDIQRVGGFLSDHYDPRKKVVRLSPDVHDGRSIAALSVACHEVGHAIQDAKSYKPLVIRNAAVPVAGFGSNFAFILIIIAFFLGGAATQIGYLAAIAGVGLFGATVVFQIINLPVEFNASARAKEIMPELGLIGRDERERDGVNAVLNAAAMTYVAATITSLMMLLYWAWRLGLFGRR